MIRKPNNNDIIFNNYYKNDNYNNNNILENNNNNKDIITLDNPNNIEEDTEYKNNANYSISTDESSPYIKEINYSLQQLQSKLEEKDREINKIKNEYDLKINNLNLELSEKNNEIKKKKENIKDKENNINNLNMKLSEKNNEIKKKAEDIKEKEKNIYNLNKELSEKNNENEDNKRKINDLNNIIKSYKKQVDNYNLILSSNEEKISQLAKYNLISKVEINNQKSIIEEFMPKYDQEDPLNFYDIIVDINSIKKFNKGWTIYKSKNKGNISQFLEENSIKIGVVGNGNKGKSFLLSKISDIDLPVGESIKTKGLSIKFPQIEQHSNRTITLLDSAGQETPVLNNDLEDIQQYNIQKETLKGESNETTKEEKLTEKSRDKLLTEFFLQNYIVKYSDLLIIVVGILTFSEQKLINKIKKTYINLNKKGQLIVIHNLQSYVTLSQVDNYIRDTLLKSDTFKLKEKYQVSKEMTYNRRSKEPQWKYFYEPKQEPNTIHLIFAREKSDAGNYYNKKAIEHIYEIINTINEKEPLNVCENIKDLFINLSNQILETQIQEKDIEIGENIIQFKKDDKNNELKLKRCSIDELGLNNFSSSGFNPSYCYYVYNNMLYIILEVPGEINKESFKVNADCDNGKCIIKINGNKINDIAPIEKDCSKKFIKREFGEYNFTIIIEDINISSKNGKLEKGNGLIKITYPIAESSSTLTF